MSWNAATALRVILVLIGVYFVYSGLAAIDLSKLILQQLGGRQYGEALRWACINMIGGSALVSAIITHWVISARQKPKTGSR